MNGFITFCCIVISFMGIIAWINANGEHEKYPKLSYSCGALCLVTAYTLHAYVRYNYENIIVALLTGIPAIILFIFLVKKG